MMKHSAGILAYKIEDKKIKVLLAHMGGPYWKNREHAWSIPKGEFTEETAIDAAIREFREETGFSISKESLKFLTSEKQNSNKLVTIFYTKTDLDTSQVTSNEFEIEWPPKSGRFQKFPEMDKAEWIEIEEAKQYILKGQIKILDKLKMILS